MRSSIAPGTNSERGPMNVAPMGVVPPPIHTGCCRNSPGVWRGWLAINARCIATMASASIRADGSRAARMAVVLATIISVLRVGVPPGSSASATARADAVRFSICELAADSDLSSTADNGAISLPSSASNRAMSRLAAFGAGVNRRRQIQGQVGNV